MGDFSKIFKILDEKSFLENPNRILSYMMDFGFSRPQITMMKAVLSDDRRKFIDFLRCTNSDSRKISDNIAEYCMFNPDRLFELLNGTKSALYPETALPTKIVNHKKYGKCLESDDGLALYSPDGRTLLEVKDCNAFKIPDFVKSIGRGAFYDCKSLKSVIIPDSVTSIGDGAFCDCESLESVVIPDSVTSIGEHAFHSCESLENVVIPDSVTSIGDCAFFDCESLESVVIPDSVTSIGESAFSGCESLESVVIPDSVTSIGESAFSHCESLESVVIPDSVTSIGRGAFYGCKSLESVVIPDSVTSIGESAFSGYDHRMFCVGKNNPNYRSLDGCILCGNELLYGRINNNGCAVIPDSVTSIGDDAFYGCKSLESVVIPDSVTSIGWRAFENCKSLECVVIPDSVTNIGNLAFLGCDRRVFYVGKNNPNYRSLDGCLLCGNELLYGRIDNNGCAVIPDSVTSIGDSAFYGCKSLECVVIPDSVTSIGDCAFKYCRSLKNVVIPDSVTSIGWGAFYGCDRCVFSVGKNNPSYHSLDGCLLCDNELLYGRIDNNGCAVIPDSVTSIGESAFSGCESLESVVIPDSVTSIGESAFSHCESLESVVIPDSVTSIGKSVFLGCNSLKNVVIPDSVTSIGKSAFDSHTIVTRKSGKK